MPRRPRAGLLTALRIVVAALIAGVVVVTVVLATVLGRTWSDPLPWAQLGFVAAAAVIAFVVIERFQYGGHPLKPKLPADRAAKRSRRVFVELLLVRLGIVTTVIVISIALPFLRPGGGVHPLLLGAAATIALLVICVWPSERAVAKTERALERAGARSHLRDSLGLTPTSTQPPPTVPVPPKSRPRPRPRTRRRPR